MLDCPIGLTYGMGRCSTCGNYRKTWPACIVSDRDVNSYLAAYSLILICSFLLVSIDGFSVETNVSAVIACFNNVGPGLDVVGPVGSYSEFGILSKIILIIDMLAGRLEIFPILALLSVSLKKSH